MSPSAFEGWKAHASFPCMGCVDRLAMHKAWPSLPASASCARYTLVKFTDMHAEMREEAMDICITAVEKYPNDMEKCTQVRTARGNLA